jgi:hypothetical protein
MRVVALTGRGGGEIGNALAAGDVHLCVLTQDRAHSGGYWLPCTVCATASTFSYWELNDERRTEWMAQRRGGNGGSAGGVCWKAASGGYRGWVARAFVAADRRQAEVVAGDERVGLTALSRVAFGWHQRSSDVTSYSITFS